VREDAFQYHQRVVTKFAQAVINKQDARDEAVEVLLSSQNLENNGYAHPIFKQEAEEYINSAFEVANPPPSEQARIFTSKDTSSEAAPARHHKMIRQFSDDKLTEALKLDDEGNLHYNNKVIDRLVRKYLGFRMQSMPNRSERGNDIVGEHSKFHVLNMFPSREGEVAYGEKPLFQQLSRYLYKNNGENAQRLNKEMVKVAKKMHPSLKDKHLFSNWEGNNVTINSVFERGLNDFKESFAKRYGQNHPLLSLDNLNEHFIRAKNWENEGLPRKLVFDTLFGDDGIPVTEGKDGVSPIQKLRKKADEYNDARRRPKEGEDNFGRVGIDAYRLGIAMLPYEDQYNIMKWMLVTNGGTNDDGTIDDSFLNSILGPDARGYMAHHAYLMDNVLNTLYAGGSDRSGTMSHTLPNRFLGKARADVAQKISERQEKVKERLENNDWYTLDDETLAAGLGQFNLSDIVTKYADENELAVVDDGGTYPHIKSDDFGDFIIMNDKVPDIKQLIDKKILDEEQIKSLIKSCANAYGSQDYSDLLRESINDYTHTHNTNEEFSMLDEPKMYQTAKGIVMEGVGRRGNMDGETGDFARAYEEAYDNFIRASIKEKRFIMPARKVRDKTGSRKTVEQTDEFDPSKDVDGQLEVDLLAALDRYNYSPDQKLKLYNQFKDGKTVKLEMPRKNMTVEGAVDIVKPTGTEYPLYDELESYAKDMPDSKTIATPGLNSFYMAHSDNLGLDMQDLVGFLSLDNLPKSTHTTALHTPMYLTRKARVGSQTANKRRLLDVEELPSDHEGSEARQLGYVPNAIKNEDKLMIDAMLLGLHEPLHTHDDASMDAFEKAIDPKNADRLSSLKNANTHKDMIGYGGRTGKDMIREILREESPATHYAIYHKEDYDEYMKNRLTDVGDYQLPEAQVENVKTRGRLLQELKHLDSQYREAQTQEERDKRAADLNKMVYGYDYESDEPKPVAMRKHGDDDEPTFSSLVIAPTPSYLASLHSAEVSQALRIAHKNGDDRSAELLEKKLSMIRDSAPPQDGGEIKLKNHETRMDNYIDTLNAVKKIFTQAVRPAIEKIYPNIFIHDNDKAYAATAYALKLCEQIAMLSPSERSMLFSGKDNIKLGGKTASFDLSEDQIDDLTNLHVSRLEHKGSESMAEKMLDSSFGGVQPKGHTVMSKLATDSPHIPESDVKIFEQVVNNVKEAAKQQGISFEQAFTSRYFPHDPNSKAVKGVQQSNVFDIINIPKRGGNNLIFNNGGVFKEVGGEYLQHGGESATDAKGNPVSMSKERQVIFDILHNTHKETKGGSDVALDFKKMKFFKGFKPNFRNVMNINNPDSLRNIAKLMIANTDTALQTKSARGLNHETPMGGYNMNNAPVAPIFTSGHKKFHYGIDAKSPFVAVPGSLQDGKLLLEDDDTHIYNSPSLQRLVMPRNVMRWVNPQLPPLDTSQPLSHIRYQEFDNEPNQNQRMGQSINQAMNFGQPNVTDDGLFNHSYSDAIDVMIDDTLLIKDDGKPQPVKFMHRIFDLEDMQHLRGFTGDWVISLYPQGEHIIASKKGKKLTAYNAEGEIKLDDVFKDEINKVYEKDFIVHAILHDGIMTVLDLLKTADEDTHNMPTKDRIRHLRAQYESSEHIKMPEPINTKRSDDEGLQVAIENLRNEDNIDILLRDANATYMKGEPRHPKWVLLSKEKMVDVIILSRAGKNYTVGVGPLMHPENYGKRAQQVGEEHYMNVGSAKGPRGLNVGDYATVRCTGVSASKKEYPVYRIRSAKITDNEPLAADSVETLAIMSGEHHVPQQVNMKKGKITITFPAFDDEVICKTRKEDSSWVVEPHTSIWGNDYLVKLARDQEAYWELKAAWLLKQKEEDEPEYDEVDPEPPAGHFKKPKQVLEDEEEVIKRGLELVERGLEHLAKEKITSTGVQGLGMDYATYDESPRGPTENIRDNTMPDFDPQARSDDDVKPAKGKKTKRLRTSEGETARLEDDGVIAIEDSSLDIQ